MDIIRAEVAYLGWDSGALSGIAWRKRATQSEPADRRATGSVKNSNIHHNYFGLYAFRGLWPIESSTTSCTTIFPTAFRRRTAHQGFTVSDNQVYNNGKHGH